MEYKGFRIEPTQLDHIQFDDHLDQYVVGGRKTVFKITHLASGISHGHISTIEAAKKRIDRWVKDYPTEEKEN